MASRCAPRATTDTSWPAAARRKAIWPPMAPAPRMQIFMQLPHPCIGNRQAIAHWRKPCAATVAGGEIAGLFGVGHLQIAADLLQTLLDLVETRLQTIERPGHGHEIVGAVPAEGRREGDDRLR